MNGPEPIKNNILEIRGKKVILDFELAKMYQVETKRLKESVRRNIRRFPIDFMFELTKEEWNNLRSQIATSSWGGSRYVPLVFTEQGVAMLSSVLNSASAIQVNIQIMRAFVKLREIMATHKELKEKTQVNTEKINDLNSDLEKKRREIIELSEKINILGHNYIFAYTSTTFK